LLQDAKWVAAKRQGRATDAILSCPGCFTTVCMECQQHAVLHTQYRAVFTMNCSAKSEAHIRVPTQRGSGGASSGGGGRKRKGPEEGGSSGAGGGGVGGVDGEVMYPVYCDVCETQVGAQDSDEVVHFYHVLASNP
jgi:hypothetical protein